ncbi:hypothetical protein E5Q_02150 [Mixia osmundae IAM 14324]|uniref:Large ribosomal subunit protein mL49 n=2 Tax=Mixia osmundae (strain CBS 9802 / IAM 14324 / JCM 22182 / KY 12970) TaxID=764103 RepID=G7DY35_MIXOS|nr:hypothetical protein E5Q_02150 [Mixia osmundae IAM 14324]
MQACLCMSVRRFSSSARQTAKSMTQQGWLTSDDIRYRNGLLKTLPRQNRLQLLKKYPHGDPNVQARQLVERQDAAVVEARLAALQARLEAEKSKGRASPYAVPQVGPSGNLPVYGDSKNGARMTVIRKIEGDLTALQLDLVNHFAQEDIKFESRVVQHFSRIEIKSPLPLTAHVKAFLASKRAIL